MNLFKSTALALLFLSVNMLTAQESISLNLKKGETYTLNQTSISNIDQVVDGMPVKTTTTVVAVTEFTVTGMNGKNYLITITPTKMSTTQESDMGSMTMDSEGDTSDPMNVMMKNLVNKPLTMELSPNGDISNFKSDGYLDGIMDGIDMPAMAKIQLGAQMQEQYSDEALMDSYKFYFSFYPKTKVATGDTWKSEFTLNIVVPMSTMTNNELKSVTNDSYMIYSTADLTTNGEQDSNIMGMKAKANLNGTLSANYVLDKKTGWISSMEQTQNLEGDMVILKSAQLPEDMKMTMKVDAVNTVTSK
jgi:hypothetical protein